MIFERPADEIREGDVIAYAPGGQMLVTIPGQVESVPFLGRRVGHHGVVLTAPLASGYKKGKTMSTLHTPRQKVEVFERRAFQRGDMCMCAHHRKLRGELEAPLVFPPVVNVAAPLSAPEPERALSSAPAQGGEDAGPGAGRELPPGGAAAGDPWFELARDAALLMPGWIAQGPAYDGERAAYLVNVDGRRLKVAEDYRRPLTHVHVTVLYPLDSPLTIFGADRPETRFAHQRPAAAFVATLKAKILPRYDRRFPEVQDATEAARRRRAAAESFAERIAHLVPTARVDENIDGRVVATPHPGSVERMTANVSGRDHTVQFRWVNSETLEALVQTYGAMVKARHERVAAARRSQEVEAR